MFVSVTKARAGGEGNHAHFYNPDDFLIDLASCKVLFNIRVTASRMMRMDNVTAIPPIMAPTFTARPLLANHIR